MIVNNSLRSFLALISNFFSSYAASLLLDRSNFFLFCAFLFPSRTCWGLLFLLLANAQFSSLIWSEFNSLHLLNARFEIHLFFRYFLVSLPAEVYFAGWLLQTTLFAIASSLKSDWKEQLKHYVFRQDVQHLWQ